MFTKALAAVAVVAVVSYSACKPKAETGSEVKSLDNLTRDPNSGVTTNFCGIAMTRAMVSHLSANDQAIIKKRIKADSETLRLAVAGALTAVPKEMQQVFFASKGGRIHAVANVQSRCEAGAPTEAEVKFFSEGKKAGGKPELNGCWAIEGDALNIYVKSDIEVIHHGLLRVFASMYSEFYAPRLEAFAAFLPADQKARMAKKVDDFNALADALGPALIDDLEALNPKQAAAFKELKRDDPGGFRTAVFADTVDSAYCSTGSKHVLDTKFPNVAKVVKRAMAPLFGPESQ